MCRLVQKNQHLWGHVAKRGIPVDWYDISRVYMCVRGKEREIRITKDPD